MLFPDPSKPTATVNITYLVGSRQENYGETGMAHLLEHLIFKGSKNFPHPDAEFNRRGFRNNGSTWLDRTNYFSTFQASDDNLKWAIDWSADAMVNSFIAKKDLDSEMTVVRNEFEMGKTDPSRLMFERNQALLYDWHNYGKSTIGARSDIEHVRIENLQAFYRMYYQPDNAVLIVAGKFDEAKALRWIADAFGRIPKPKRTLPVLWTEEPTHDGERQFTIRRKGEVQIVNVAYRMPEFAASRRAAGRLRRRHPRRHAERPPAQGAGRKRQGVAGVRLHGRRKGSWVCDFRRSCQEGRAARAGGPDDDRGDRDVVRQAARDRRGDASARCRTRRPDTSAHWPILSRSVSDCRSTSRSVTGACSSIRATAWRK